MKLILLVFVCVVLLSAPASACRGLWEYPQTMKQLAMMDMKPAAKKAYKKRLHDGFAIHERGHASKNKRMMKEAVGILDQIKLEIMK